MTLVKQLDVKGIEYVYEVFNGEWLAVQSANVSNTSWDDSKLMKQLLRHPVIIKYLECLLCCYGL